MLVVVGEKTEATVLLPWDQRRGEGGRRGGQWSDKERERERYRQTDRKGKHLRRE
jgi:hypothetical protein